MRSELTPAAAKRSHQTARIGSQLGEEPPEAATTAPAQPNSVLAHVLTGGSRGDRENAADGSPHGSLGFAARALGVDVTGIRIAPLRGTAGVSAETRGETIHVAEGRAPGDSPENRRLLAHELAHVVQHRNASRGGVPAASDEAIEWEARAVGSRVARGERAHVRLAAAPGVIRRSTLSDTVRTAPTTEQVFDALRAASATERADPDVLREAQSRFHGLFDINRWIAGSLIRFGPETLWPAHVIYIVASLARSRGRGAGPGDIAGDIADPDPDPSPAPQIPPLRAFFFLGVDPAERVLVIGGVHGSEPEGIEVVERLHQRLKDEAAQGNPPRFTTILIPTLIARTAHPGRRDKSGKNYDPGKRDDDWRYVPVGVSRGGRGSTADVEPNRNNPFPGIDYATARALGASGGAELETLPSDPKTGAPMFGAKRRPPRAPQPKPGEKKQVDRTTTIMLPETRALIALLERFQPTRIVSVHSHGPSQKVGDAPGVFVDPRGIDPSTGKVTAPAAVAADDGLTQKLLARAQLLTPEGIRAKAFAGNAPKKGTKDPNVRYATTAHQEGNSLGMYGPVATPARPAATTITIEVAQGMPVGNNLDALIDAYRDAIDEVILR
jgi:hypothetical protein